MATETKDMCDGPKEIFFEHVEELEKNISENILRVVEKVHSAPAEWIHNPGEVCASGNCGKSDPSSCDDVCDNAVWAVHLCLYGAFLDDRSYGRLPLRVRLAVGSSYGDGMTWPYVFILDPITHVVVDPRSGEVDNTVFDIYFDGHSADSQGKRTRGSIWSAIEILQALLTSTAPMDALGGADPHLEYAWTNAAARQLEFVSTAAAYASVCLDHRFCLDPRRADADQLAHLERTILSSDDDLLEPALKQALQAAPRDGGASLRGLCREECSPGHVYSLPMLTQSCCENLIREVENFEASGLPVRRPNSMNNYGVIVTEIGMGPFMTALQRIVTQPIAALLFPEEGQWLDSHHSFTVRYKAGEDLGLDMHTDDSDVTFNICLGKQGFSGAGLTFCGMIGKASHRQFKHRYTHSIGRCVIHLGRQRHGADDISEGTRVNLIMWNKSRAFRRRTSLRPPPYEREGAEPSYECLSFTHDRDFTLYKALPANSNVRNRGWCPPPGKEYQGEGDSKNTTHIEA